MKRKLVTLGATVLNSMRRLVRSGRSERKRCLRIIESEEELNGPMPDAIWDEVKGDREAVERLCRVMVKTTKANIVNRIHQET